ncbi:MAG: MerR family transcriptional regulator [Candidatus Omnitrophota bacterium]
MRGEKYYSASEVARVLSISKQTLVRYESKGVFPRARRNRVNNWREYTVRDVNYLKEVLGRLA